MSDDSREFLAGVVSTTIVPMMAVVQVIWEVHGVVVAVFEPTDRARDFLRKDLGWDGLSPVFRLPRGAGRRMADGCKQLGETVTGDWLKARRYGRVFLVAHDCATLLLNYNAAIDLWDIEPGSTDTEWMS